MPSALTILALLATAVAFAQGPTQVRFTNVGPQIVYVVTDVGPNLARSNLTLEPKAQQVVNVGNGSLKYCYYSGNKTPPCRPGVTAAAGSNIEVK
jgi:hypothetical protein